MADERIFRCLVQPAGSRPGTPGNFHLLAQMKVTKAKGLNTIRAGCFGKSIRSTQVASIRGDKRPTRRAGAIAFRHDRAGLANSICASIAEHFSRRHLFKSCWTFCFGYFPLGQQRKVTGHAGPGPGGLSRTTQTSQKQHGSC
jgi:hypothetical protein